MPSEREALQNIIAQVEQLISTTTPLPENRTPRCLELLRAAAALAKKRPAGEPQPDMDAAQAEARPELEQNWEQWNAKQVAEWWKRWHLSAGHRRLGRMLMEVTGVKIVFRRTTLTLDEDLE